MTHTTDQERAEPIKMQPGDDLHLTMLMASHGLNFVTGKDRDQLLAWGRDVWQAARRAPSMPDQSIIEAVDGWFARNTDLGGCSDKDVAELAAIFAAAPQPPEAGCSVSNGETQAAPVQLPEPAAQLWQHGETGRTRVVMPDAITDCDAGWQHVGALYTEQQVRDLLAAHGIGKDKA